VGKANTFTWNLKLFSRNKLFPPLGIKKTGSMGKNSYTARVVIGSIEYGSFLFQTLDSKNTFRIRETNTYLIDLPNICPFSLPL